MIRYFIIATFLIFLSLSAPVSPAVSGEEHYPEVTVREIVENKEFYDNQKVSLYEYILGLSVIETREDNILHFLILGGAGKGYYLYVLLPFDFEYRPTVTHITVIGTYYMSQEIEGITIRHVIKAKYLF